MSSAGMVRLQMADCNWTCARASECHEYECDGESHFVQRDMPNAKLSAGLGAESCAALWRKQMDTENETLIGVLRDRMQKMTDEDRIDLMHALMDGYCRHCGSDHLPCYCTRDD